MGIKLVEEVMDWCPDDVTPAQRWCLTVLARDANDVTRETWHGPEHPEILRRVRMSPKKWEAMRSILLKRGLIEPVSGGFRGRAVRYRIASLFAPCVVQDWRKTPLERGAFGGYAVKAERKDPPAEGVNEAERPPTKGGQSAERPPYRGGPTPPTAFSSPPTSLPAPPEPPVEADPPSGGGGGGQQEQQHLDRATHFVDTLDYRGQQPSRSQHQRLVKHTDAALAAGWTEQQLRGHLSSGLRTADSPLAIYLHRLKPDELPAAPPTSKTPVAVPRRAGPRCSCCGLQAPTAATINGQPYCADCTTACASCTTTVPTDHLHAGQCLTCLPIHQRTTAA